MDIFKEIVKSRESHITVVLATVVESLGSAPGKPSARMLIKGDGSIVGTIGGGAIEKKITDEAKGLMQGGNTTLLKYDLGELGMECGGAMTVFLEPLTPTPHLIIFGAGHIGSALCRIGKMVGFTTTVVDNRAEFANREQLPLADAILADDFQKALQGLVFSDTTYVVILTHKHVHDFEVLQYCSQQPFCYLGMIGSRRKVAKAFEQLRDRGVSEDTCKRIHAPIGIDIGAETPEEIAVAIAAELLAVRSDTSIVNMKSTIQHE